MQKQMIQPEKIFSIAKQLGNKVGLPEEHSAIVAKALVSANLRGVDTHGIRCLPNYLKRFEHNSLNRTPKITIEKESAVTAAINGDNGLGHICGVKAMEIAVDKAQKSGVGIVSVRNSNHFGATAYFSMMALEHNFIGLAMTNATARLAPTGGTTPCYGNNPWSIAIPSGNIPIVVDMANSVVANSHIIIAREKGEKIPLGWALTKNGEPTQDPNLAELLLPIAGYKGYGIAVVVEVLSGILSGASFGKDVGLYNSLNKGQDVGHFFMAIDIEQFMAADVFKAKVDTFIQDIKQSELAVGSERVYLPGEKEYLQYEKRLKEGIPVDREVIDEINSLCSRYAVGESFSD